MEIRNGKIELNKDEKKIAKLCAIVAGVYIGASIGGDIIQQVVKWKMQRNVISSLEHMNEVMKRQQAAEKERRKITIKEAKDECELWKQKYEETQSVNDAIMRSQNCARAKQLEIIWR